MYLINLLINYHVPFNTEGTPLPPSTPRIDAVTDTSITFSWVPGSADTVYYVVRYINLATKESDSIDVYDTKHTLDNLDLNTEYCIWVIGFNKLGVRSPSNRVIVRTGDVYVPRITDTTTEQPSRGKYEQGRNGEIFLSVGGGEAKSHFSLRDLSLFHLEISILVDPEKI